MPSILQIGEKFVQVKKENVCILLVKMKLLKLSYSSIFMSILLAIFAVPFNFNYFVCSFFSFNDGN